MARNFIVLDTEGVDTVKHTDGKAHPETSLFYDLGFIVVDGGTGKELASYSLVNSDVFNETDLMDTAYYARKRSTYDRGMKCHDRIAMSTSDIFHVFHYVCKFYGVRDVWAYNVHYDKTITEHTVEVMSRGFVEQLLPDGVRWRDIWTYAGSTLCNTRKYVEYCLTRDYITDKGNPSTRAEAVYRYLIEDDSFIEEHTALEDARIELEILQACKRRHQRARHCIGDGWREAASILEML